MKSVSSLMTDVSKDSVFNFNSYRDKATNGENLLRSEGHNEYAAYHKRRKRTNRVEDDTAAVAILESKRAEKAEKARLSRAKLRSDAAADDTAAVEILESKRLADAKRKQAATAKLRSDAAADDTAAVAILTSKRPYHF